MNIFGKEMNNRYLIWIILHVLIVIDIVLITIVMFFDLPDDVVSIISTFDFCICAVLLIEWSINFYLSKPKKIFLKQKSNWLDLIASIPFDALLPAVIPFAGLARYLRLLKLLRVVALFNRFFHGFNKFLDKTNLDKILGGVFFTILIFTLVLYVFGPSYGLFDDFYFVVVTLTTVGYGDVTPKTFNEKIIAIILIFVGIFVFSTITAVISSYFTDKLIKSDEEEEFNSIKEDFKLIHEENQDLKQEIQELKQETKELKELIKGD